jgi:hypothetical protein
LAREEEGTKSPSELSNRARYRISRRFLLGHSIPSLSVKSLIGMIGFKVIVTITFVPGQ